MKCLLTSQPTDLSWFALNAVANTPSICQVLPCWVPTLPMRNIECPRWPKAMSTPSSLSAHTAYTEHWVSTLIKRSIHTATNYPCPSKIHSHNSHICAVLFIFLLSDSHLLSFPEHTRRHVQQRSPTDIPLFTSNMAEDQIRVFCEAVPALFLGFVDATLNLK